MEGGTVGEEREMGEGRDGPNQFIIQKGPKLLVSFGLHFFVI